MGYFRLASLKMLGHVNIVKYDNRPFANVLLMNQGIIENFNKVVKDKDDVYYLGDFALNIEQGIEILNKVNGRWHLIVGNHDRSIMKIINRSTKKMEWIDKIKEVKMNGVEITLCHYPMLNWNKSHHGKTWHLFGHNHKKTCEEIPGKRLNVIVNQHDYKPWSFDEIAEFMKGREHLEKYKKYEEE